MTRYLVLCWTMVGVMLAIIGRDCEARPPPAAPVPCYGTCV